MTKYLPLYDGFDIPQVGVASFRYDSQEATRAYIELAFNRGIRLYEVSELYGNARLVIDTLHACLHSAGLQRSDVFIIVKAWPKNRKLGEITNACKFLLASSGLSYADVVCVHAPIDIENRSDQWAALEGLKEEQLVRSLGCADVNALQVTELVKNCAIMPSTVTCELSIFTQKKVLTEYLNDSSIIVISNEVNSKGMRKNHPVLSAITQEVYGPPSSSSSGESDMEMMNIRFLLTSGYVVLLDHRCAFDMAHLLEPLSAEVVRRLRSLDEDLCTQWTHEDPAED